MKEKLKKMRPEPKFALLNMVLGFIGLAESLVLIFSLGLIYPVWTFNFAHWRVKRQLKGRESK